MSLYQLPRIRQTEMTDTEAVFRDHAPGFFPRMFEAIRAGWYAVLDVVVAVTAAWPLWLAIALVVYGVRRWRKLRPSRRPPPIDG